MTESRILSLICRGADAIAHAAAAVAGISRIDEDGSTSLDDGRCLAVTRPLVIAAAHAAAGGTRARKAAASGTTTKKALPSARSGVWT